MDAAPFGKHVSQARIHEEEACRILDMGVHEEVSEYIALLCADTQLLYAEHELACARRAIAHRRENLKLEMGV